MFCLVTSNAHRFPRSVDVVVDDAMAADILLPEVQQRAQFKHVLKEMEFNLLYKKETTNYIT